MTTIFQTATRAAQAEGREFQSTLDRYATPSIKERLLSDLRRSP
jgi:hypothetical protein